MNPSPPSPRPRWRRLPRLLLFNPLSTTALVVVLVLDVRSLPNDPVFRGVSTIGSLVSPRGGLLPIHRHYAYDAFFRRTDDGLVLGTVFAPESLAATGALHRNTDDVLWATYKDPFIHRGFWAITYEDYGLDIRNWGAGAPPTPEERREIARQASDSLRAVGNAALAELVGGRPQPMRRHIWTGYLHNALSLGAFLALLCSLRWAPARLSARRLRRGLCPECAYPIGASPVCTECGMPVPARHATTKPT